MSKPRSFPPPWTIDEMNGVCFIVRNRNGQQLGAQPAHDGPSAHLGRGTAAGGQLREIAGLNS